MTLQPWRAWWSRVNRQTLVQDLSAGLSGALIVLPQGMAYAMIAGLPPQFGLYCAVVPSIVAALLGSSWHMVSGPTAAISIVIYATLAPLAPVGSANYIAYALTLGFLAGLLQVVVAVVHLGKLSDRIPHSVIIGFTTGAACLIAASQLKHVLGVSLPAVTGFFPTLRQAANALPAASWAVVLVALATMLATVITRRYLKPLPHLVTGMVVGAVVAGALGAPEIRLVGALPSALPQLSMPLWDLSVWQTLSTSSAVVALLALTEAIAISRAVATRSGQAIDGNQETFGQGMSNVAGAFFSGYPSSGSFTRSGINFEAGAQTPLAAVFASFILIALLVFIAPLVAYLPLAAMAGVLLIVAWGLIDLGSIRECFHRRSETCIFMLTFLACLFSSIEVAVFSGIALAVAWRLLAGKR
jgi:sulfate permease, SulP family